ncbi:hypothetical protein D5S18_24170 [Nocardia panacis]|uniref:Uncharacterized protein n=1 Tax=Nocardia panacis TaxID=2340916 RepID=A0A3A4KR98_9NOCA|nr:hypothetical protein D5S18_24170 [Nocardia panacis]
MATLFAAPAGAAPQDAPTIPPTIPPTAPAQPGIETPATETPAPNPGADAPTSETPAPKPDNAPKAAPNQPPTPSPSQPGVTTPEPNQALPGQKKPQTPTQPGVTTPRIAPLPVPGQQPGDMPAVMPDQPGVQQPKPAPGGTQQQPGAVPPGQANPAKPQPPADDLVQTPQPPQQPRWQSPQLQSAPPAPVVEMSGPHLEVGANVDGGAVLPGFVANTHHFSNKDGYVGTVGYHTPTGAGEAGISVEFVDINTIKVTSYTGGEGLADGKNTAILDTTQLNLAKAAVEQWIESQPGGAAALDAARHAAPPILPPGDVAPQTVDVGGVTTQWGGSLQY